MIEKLSERVERLEGPDREIDAEIASAVLGGKIIWKTQNYTMDQYPVRRFSSKNHASGFGCDPVELYTASLDAAMSLVPEGVNSGEVIWNVEGWSSNGVHAPHVRATAWVAGAPRVYAATPAIALCAAALKSQGL